MEVKDRASRMRAFYMEQRQKNDLLSEKEKAILRKYRADERRGWKW